MVQPVNHGLGSETATTVLGGLKGGLFYGALGTIATTLVGALVVGGVFAGAGALVGGLFSASAAIATVGAYVGGAIGAIGGFTYGGAASVIGGGIAGIFEGRSQAAREQGLANTIEREKSNTQGQMIASARGDAIEQGVAMGYMQGMQEGQAVLMNHIAAAQQQQMQAAAPAQEQDCTPCKAAKNIIAKHEDKHGHGHVSHVDKVTANAAEPSLGQAV